MRQCYHYDVYNNGVLVYAEKTVNEIEKLMGHIGVNRRIIQTYCSRESDYKKQWRFVFHGNELTDRNTIPSYLWIEWDKMREVFMLLKEGKAVIVCVNGVRYTKRK